MRLGLEAQAMGIAPEDSSTSCPLPIATLNSGESTDISLSLSLFCVCVLSTYHIINSFTLEKFGGTYVAPGTVLG